MKNFSSLDESDYLKTKKRLEEQLKILKTHRELIKKNKRNKNHYKKLVFLSSIIIVCLISFYSYKEYQKNSINPRQSLRNKISFFKEQKFRDSVNLLAMNIEIENRAYKKMEDSIQLEVAKKWYAIISDSTHQTQKKAPVIKKSVKIKNRKKHTNTILNSSLKPEKSKFKTPKKEIQSNRTSPKPKETTSTSKKIDNTIKVFAVFPGCVSKQKKQSCFDNKINRFIRKRLNKKLFKKSGVGQVNVLFTISKNGLVKIVKINGAINEIIKNEVIRVIESLPRFKPALNKENIPISMPYSVTIGV